MVFTFVALNENTSEISLNHAQRKSKRPFFNNWLIINFDQSRIIFRNIIARNMHYIHIGRVRLCIQASTLFCRKGNGESSMLFVG